MSTQLRFMSKFVCMLAFGLLALISGPKAHAQSVSITNFSATGNPGGYYNVSDTVSLGLAFNGITSPGGGYGYGIVVYAYYYSGPNGSGTFLGSTSQGVYNNGGSLPAGNSTVSNTVTLNTPATMRALEPAGTQSFVYVYTLQGGCGCNGWSGNFSTGGPWFMVHG